MELTASTEQILERLKLTFGETPEVFLNMMPSPEYLAASDFMRRNLSTISMEPVYRQILVYYFSFKNGSEYCVNIHHEILNMHGYECSIANTEQDFFDMADDRITALLNFAKEVVDNCGEINKETRERFLEAGFTKKNMLEVLLVNMFALSVNQMSRFSEI